MLHHRITRTYIASTKGSVAPYIAGIVAVVVLLAAALLSNRVIQRTQERQANKSNKPLNFNAFKAPKHEARVTAPFNVIYNAGLTYQGKPNGNVMAAQTPCSPPASFSVLNRTQTSIFISWTAVPPTSGARWGQRITRTGGSQPPLNIQLSGGNPTYNDTGLSPGTQYNYTIVAYCDDEESTPLVGSATTLGQVTQQPTSTSFPTAPPTVSPTNSTAFPTATPIPSVPPGSLELIPDTGSGLPRLPLSCTYLPAVCNYVISKGGRMQMRVTLHLKDKKITFRFACGAGNAFCTDGQEIGASLPIPCNISDAMQKYCDFLSKDGSPVPSPLPSRSPSSSTSTAAPTASPSSPPGQSPSPPGGTIPPGASPSTSPSGSGYNADIPAIIGSISETNIRNNMAELVDDDSTPERDQRQSRHVNFNYRVEAQFVKRYYESLGIQVEEQLVAQANNTSNLIATIPGENTEEIYVLVGHLDTRGDSNRFDGRNGVAPGADDNGSGSSALMEIARAVKASNPRLKYTIKIVHTTGHEMDCVCLPGTKLAANTLSGQYRIKGVINMDMFGYKCPFGDCINVQYNASRPGEGTLANKVVSMNSQYNIGLQVQAINDTRPSDHIIFSAMGIPAVFTFEQEFNAPNYHSPTDTMEQLSFSQITKNTKMVAAAITTLALGR